MVYFVLFDAQARSEFEKVLAEMAAARESQGAPQSGRI
jgi:hypothetical protein